VSVVASIDPGARPSTMDGTLTTMACGARRSTAFHATRRSGDRPKDGRRR